MVIVRGGFGERTHRWVGPSAGLALAAWREMHKGEEKIGWARVVRLMLGMNGWSGVESLCRTISRMTGELTDIWMGDGRESQAGGLQILQDAELGRLREEPGRVRACMKVLERTLVLTSFFGSNGGMEM